MDDMVPGSGKRSVAIAHHQAAFLISCGRKGMCGAAMEIKKGAFCSERKIRSTSFDLFHK